MPRPSKAHLVPVLLALACEGIRALSASPMRPGATPAPRALPPATTGGPLAPRPGERRAAVERILEVELQRLTTAVELNIAKLSLPKHLQAAAPSTDEILTEAKARAPMLRWAINRWFIESLGIEKYGVWCPTLKKLELHPWQWTPKGHPTLTPPTFVESLVTLRPQLTEEIKRGFRNSPLRACRLVYRAIIVYALAAMSDLPGPQRKLIQRTWPRLVQHLATTMELNHDRALLPSPEAPARRRSLQAAKVTAPGQVAKAAEPAWLEGLGSSSALVPVAPPKRRAPAWLEGPRRLWRSACDSFMCRWDRVRSGGKRAYSSAYD